MVKAGFQASSGSREGERMWIWQTHCLNAWVWSSLLFTRVQNPWSHRGNAVPSVAAMDPIMNVTTAEGKEEYW